MSNLITLKEVKANPEVKHLITGANDLLSQMGYTEHGHRHSGVVSGVTRYILQHCGADEREQELGAVAAYLHDIGNVVNRVNHPMIGAAMSYQILHNMGMDAREIAPVLGAIGNHEEGMGLPVSRMSAALIIADKSDVHFSRVQNPILESFDIHDRVNYSVQKSRVEMSSENQNIELLLEINESATVMDYFEIFLSRMVMCKRSAEVLGYKFTLQVNGTVLE
ncbi:MAG: HD domain-containing protein [Armatimonadetes bacterium]|nr:HD domain-containing protein [Armatimonadota bacterium]